MASPRSETYFSIAILIVAAVLVGLVFLPELDAIVLGISLAILFQPWYGVIKKWLHDRSAAAAGLIVLIAIAIILVPLVFFGLQIFTEAQGLYGAVTYNGGAQAPLVGWLGTMLNSWLPSLKIDPTPYVQQGINLLIGAIGPIFSGLMNVIATVLLSFFALYYFLKDGSKIRTSIVEHGPLSSERAEAVLTSLHARASSVIRGSLLVAALYGVLTGLGFFIFGLPSAILWGAVTMIASFIPGIGVLLIVIPGIVSLYLGGNILSAIGLVIWTAIMSTTIEAYLRPRLLGGKERIHPMLMLFAVLGGLSFFGPIGILLGPLALSLLLSLFENHPLFDLENLNRK
ncbi:MAG TPA: AI-2E family transporter [Candidatus Paceibacterota bacterium]